MAQILALNQNGNRLIPLVSGGCAPKEAHALLSKQTASDLFSRSPAPAAAMAGLWTYFSCFDEGHEAAQNIASREGSYWHAILHRQEPDAGNSAYWFRQVGSHPVFGELRGVAAGIAERFPKAGFEVPVQWNPLLFIELCERARQAPGTDAEQAALEIQRAEWQLLFDFCARSGS